MNETLNIILLAILQGLTEFLPVSSSGHLAITSRLLDLKEDSVMVAVVLHAGTLLSILIVYFKELISLFLKPEKRKILLELFLATIPIGMLGLILQFYGVIDYCFSNLYCSGIGLCITGIILFFALKHKENTKKVGALTIKDTLLIGLAQTPALFPGISRSGITIAAGLRRDLTPEEAAKFSFLMALPAIAGASILKPLLALKGGGDITAGLPLHLLIIGFVVSAVVGLLAIKILFVSIKKGGFKGYACYCIVLGLGIIIW